MSRAGLQAQLNQATDGFVRKLRSVSCGSGASALASDQPAASPAEQPNKRIPYPDFLNLAQNEELRDTVSSLPQLAALNAMGVASASGLTSASRSEVH